MKNLSKKQWIAVAVALVVIGLFFLSGTFIFDFLTGNTRQMNENDQNVSTGGDNVGGDNVDITPAGETIPGLTDVGLKINDIVVGTGAEATTGKQLTVHYVGTFANGQKFDSSYDRAMPFEFVLGAGNVIQGWERGFAGMKVGGKRQLVVPPEFGYGPNNYGPIPGGSTLYFEVELLGVK